MIRTYVPKTSSLRHKRKLILEGGFNEDSIFKGSSHRSSGRSRGKLVLRGRGGGWKHHRLLISSTDVWWQHSEMLVFSLLNDSRRSGGLMKVVPSFDGIPLSYSPLLLPHVDSVLPGDLIHSGLLLPSLPPVPGSCYRRKDIPIGTSVSQIGGKVLRSAGTFGVILSNEGGIISLQVGSRLLSFPEMTTAVVGPISKSGHMAQRFGKAGARRHLGFRPKVRGVAMNPVDHPHGGGEGKTSGGRPSVSPWGRLTKGGWHRY